MCFSTKDVSFTSNQACWLRLSGKAPTKKVSGKKIF